MTPADSDEAGECTPFCIPGKSAFFHSKNDVSSECTMHANHPSRHFIHGRMPMITTMLTLASFCMLAACGSSDDSSSVQEEDYDFSGGDSSSPGSSRGSGASNKASNRDSGVGSKTKSDSTSSDSYPLIFDLNSSDAVWSGEKQISVPKNEHAPKPKAGSSSSSAPTRKAYIFTGWYTESEASAQNQATRFYFEGETVDEKGGRVTPTTLTRATTIYAGWLPATLEGVVKLGKVPSDLSPYDDVAQAVLKPYKAGADVSVIYFTPNGGGHGADGKSWDKALPGIDIKSKLDGINENDQKDENKVYLFLLSIGTYGVHQSLSMKNQVAIVGGWNGPGGKENWKRPWPNLSQGTTFLGGGRQSPPFSVFSNTGINSKALLYGVTISSGYAECGGGMNNYGSSPTLHRVIFSGNVATGDGGGMCNTNDGWVRKEITNLSDVTFIENQATNGGGLYNTTPWMQLTNVMFISNRAEESGGGAAISNKYGVGGIGAPGTTKQRYVNVTFWNNSAGKTMSIPGGPSTPAKKGELISHFHLAQIHEGGGLYVAGPSDMTVINSIFWGNKHIAANANERAQIYFDGSVFGSPHMQIAVFNSIIEYGAGDRRHPLSGELSATWNRPGIGTNQSGLFPKLYCDGMDRVDPGLVSTPDPERNNYNTFFALSKNSPIADRGLYVKRAEMDYYCSEDNLSWFTCDAKKSPTSSLPPPAVDLTARDARGYARIGRPDLGAYELDGVAP